MVVPRKNKDQPTTYNCVSDKCNGVCSKEPLSVHSLVPVTPVLN